MTLDEIINVCNGRLLCGNFKKTINCFSTDTRTIKKNSCFIALHGEKFDGNDYILDALKKNAAICITDREFIYDIKNQVIIKVDDTLDALKKIAKYKREKSKVFVVAITGSNGKTTTKDLIAHILSKQLKVLKTNDNNNNIIGLSKTILSLKDEEILVLEMGMNHIHEIDEMAYVARPNIAIITNIGYSHIGNLGSKKNILKSKLEITNYMNKNDTLIINGDDELLSEINNKNYKIIKYGLKKKSDYNISFYEIKSNRIEFDIDNNHFISNLDNEIYLYSYLASYIVSILCGISINNIKKTFSNFVSPRCEIINNSGITIINDCYNASYDSMISSINYLNHFSGRKIAVLGDILEVGKFSKILHKKIGDYLLKTNVDVLITVGKYSKYYSLKNEVYHFDNLTDAINKIKTIIKYGDVILVKASHNMNFSEIISSLKGE